jgi:hypothetical protein
MTGKVRLLHSPDIADLEAWAPPDPNSFGFLLQVIAGPDSGEGEESFDVELCTPAWLERRYGTEAVVLGAYHLIVFKYNYPKIRDFIETFVRNCSGASWREVAEKIGRLGRWEFEDYRGQRHTGTDGPIDAGN